MSEKQMDTEDWKEFKKSGKAHARARGMETKELIQEYIKEEYGKVELNVIAEWHFSLIGNGKRIDIYPRRKKYHNVTINKRGTYTDIIAFLKSQF